MKIRSRLSIQFVFIVASIFILFSASLYQIFSSYRESNFYQRLKEKGLSSAKLLLDKNEVTADILRLIHNNTINNPYKIEIYKRNDLKLIYTDGDSIGQANLFDYVNRLKTNQDVHVRQGELESVFVPYNHESLNTYVYVSAIDRYGFEKLRVLKFIIWISLAISLCIIAIAALFFSSQALKPIAGIVSEVALIADTNPSARLNTGNGKDEISQIAKTFNDLLDRLHASLRMQNNFISNASHELRTPMTVIRGQIEVALMRKRTPIAYKEILNSIKDDVRVLSQLSEGLLDLAGTEIDISKIHIVQVNIYSILLQAKDELMKRNESFCIQLGFDLRSSFENLLFNGSERLLFSAFLNIMENACKYSANHSVSVFARIENGIIQIEFKDNGMGISKEDIQSIFQPFFRANNVRSLKGHGLGLALVKKIIVMHGGTVDVNSELKFGTVFKVFLPKMKGEIS